MGQAIVYCSNCSAQLRGADFDARRAFKVDDLNFCAKCCREILGSEPAAPSGSSSRTKAPPAPSPSKSSPHHSYVPIAPAPAATPSGGPLLWILAAAGIVIGIAVTVVSTGGGERRASPPSQASTPLPAPAPTSAPRPSGREAAAQEALAKALRTADLEARRTLLVDAVAQAEGTPLLADARRELDLVQRKLEIAKADKAPPPTKLEAPVRPEPVLAVPPPRPVEPPPDPSPDRAREEAARAARWEAALAPSTGRDYAAALAALEKAGNAAADLPLLKSVSSLHQEALLALSRIPKGQKVAIDFKGGKAEGQFVEVENGRVELRNDSGSVEVEVGEILPAWLADHLRSRGSAVDAAASALFCLLEGDEAGARRLAGDKAATIPERYWTYARKVAAAPDAAPTLYREVLALANNAATAADAAPKYQALLRDHAESSFVRRNRTSLASRAQLCARDFLFVAADWKPSGAFKAAKNAKGNVCWTSENDQDPAKLKENFVELSYSVLPDTPYKCWIYAGACCQETFEFWVQGTEMKSGKEREPVEPGSAAAATVKPWLSSLKKTHANHTGPKQPSHWEWVAIPLPKYEKPGLQQLRVLTAHKGFSVGFACVTATRTGPPRELELRELEKARGDLAVPAVVQGPKATVLFTCDFERKNCRVVGELRDKAIYGTPEYQTCFAGVEGNPVFTMPAQGELRVTYFLKTASPVTARFRTQRGAGQSDAYDAPFPPTVVGRPTEVRIPFSEFKEARGVPAPPLAAGDAVPMVYFFGHDVNCGLRIDAISMVELKTEAARPVVNTTSKPVFSENFDAGCGKFMNGESVEGGTKGSKALSIPGKGVDAWGAWSVPVKDTTTISFKLKPLGEVSRVDVLAWSDAHNDNCRYFIEGLKKGEWKEVRFKAAELRKGMFREGPPLDLLSSIKICLLGSAPETRVLMDDFEIRE